MASYPFFSNPGLGGLASYAARTMLDQRTNADRPPVEQPSWMNRAGAPQFLNAFLMGGNNAPEVSSGSRYLDLAMQNEAQRQFRNQAAYNAVQEGIRMQAQRAAEEQRMNGVVDGVAFRNGQPVGFAGGVPGAQNLTYGRNSPDPQGFKEGGLMGRFAPGGDEAFRQELWKRVAAMPGPQQTPTAGVAGATLAGATEAASVAASTPNISPEQMMYVTGPLAPWRQAVDRSVTQAAAAPLLEGATITERQQSKANTEAGVSARKQLEVFEKALPEVLPEIAAQAGVAVDEAVLAETILAEDKMINELKRYTPMLAQKLGVDPKILLRWAQDRRKKAKAA